MIDFFTYYCERLTDNFKLKFSLTAVICIILNYVENLAPPAKALLILMIIDWLVGLTYAFLTKRLYSKKAYQGIFKFLLYFLVWKAMYHLDIAVFHRTIEFGFANAILVYLSLTEAISVLENASQICLHLGLHDVVPQGLLHRLQLLRGKLDDREPTFEDYQAGIVGNPEYRKENRMADNKKKIRSKRSSSKTNS